MPHQAGVTNVVANLGTALTDRQVRLLSRYAKEIVLIYDADVAGQTATERSLEMFLAQQLHVRVATIPDGKDPCDYTLAHGGEAMRALIDSAPDALEYVWRRREQAYRAAEGNLAARRAISEDFLRLVVSSSAYGAIDPVRRGQLAQHIAHLLGLSPEDVQQELRRLGRAIPRQNIPSPAAVNPMAASAATTDRAERHLLEVLLNRIDLLDSVLERVSPMDFTDAGLRRIAERIWSKGQTGTLALEDVVSSAALADLSPLVAELVTVGEHRGNYEQTLAGAVELMMYRRSRQQIQALKSSGVTDDDALRRLGQQLRPDARKRPRIR